MAIERALTLYARNNVTVDTGSGIDIRNLDDTQAGTAVATQTCTATHTQDNALRTFDPATAAGATVANAWQLQKKGWALELANDMTPTDDTNCNCILPAGTAELTFDATLSTTLGVGDTTTSQDTFFQCSLWAYDPSTDAGVCIAVKGQSGVTWNPQPVGGDNGVVKTITITGIEWGGTRTVTTKALTSNVATLTTSAAHRFQVGMVVTVSISDAVFDGTFTITAIGGTAGQETTFSYAKVNANVGSTAASGTAIVTNVEFAQGSVLMLQIGLNTGVIANPVSGTTTRTYALIVDTANTKIVFATSGLLQACALSSSLVGKGTTTRTLAGSIPRSTTGKGTSSATRATVAAKSFSLVGKGTATESRAVVAARTYNLVGKGTTTRVVSVAEDFNLVGKGTTTSSKAVVAAKSFNLVGKGVVTHTKASTMSRSSTGKGVITEAHPLTAARTFSLVGKGEVPITGSNASTVTIPIDEVPTGGGGTTIIVKRNYIFDD